MAQATSVSCAPQIRWIETSADKPVPRDWLDTLARQFAQFAPLRQVPPPAATAPRIAIFSVVPWWHSVIEHLIATCLTLKRANVLTILCGGGYPACSNGTAQAPRPDCVSCLRGARRYAEALRVTYATTSDFVTSQDFVEATCRVTHLPAEALVSAVYDDVPIGRNCLRDLNQHYHYPVRQITATEEPVLRDFLASSIVNAVLARRVAERFRPEIVVISNGKAVSYSSIYSWMRGHGIDVITWDESPVFLNAFTFNRNVYASEVHLEDVWPGESRRPLSPLERAAVEEYFRGWRQRRNSYFNYHKFTVPDSPTLRAIRQKAAGRRILTFFSNLTWETSHLERNIAFDHLLDAVYFLIDLARQRSDIYVVIRAHPAEVVLPEDLHTVVPLHQSIEQRFPQLPVNATVLRADSDVNSYELAEASDVLCVYTSTIGLELALAGRPVLVLGDCHYRNKGFTVDIERPEQIQEYLDAHPGRLVLEPDRVELAWRYAYLWIFRHVVRVSYLDESTGKRYRIDDLNDLLPGSGSVFDRLTDRILHGGPFLDISRNL